jgi:hypothetical protein
MNNGESLLQWHGPDSPDLCYLSYCLPDAKEQAALMFSIIHDPLGDNEHEHEFPEDWIWGGHDQLDPRADPRWRPTTYTYLNADLSEAWVTQVPFCDDEALDYFTEVAKIKGSNPKWLMVKRPSSPLETLPFNYLKQEDMVIPV